MKQLMRHISKLAVEIGPRGSATCAEADAARYVVAKFTEYGLEAWRQPFRSVDTFSWSYLIYFMIPGVALGIAPVLPWIALALALLGAIGFYWELNSFPVLSLILPKRESLNVIGRRLDSVSPAGRQKVVIMAHLDSSKAALNFKPELVGGFRTSFIMMALSMFVPVLPLTGYVIWSSDAFLIMAAIPAIYLFVTGIFLLHREAWGRYTNGANDNASGVAVLLGLAKDAANGDYPNLDLRFVATGSEESGTFGAIALLAEYGDRFRDAYFINIDNVGAGKVQYMAGEGMFPTHRSSEELLDLAEETALRHPELEVEQGVYTLMSTDALPALVRGYKAISLLALRDGLLPNWHWVTDTYDNVEEQTVNTCYLFVSNMLHLLSEKQAAGDVSEAESHQTWTEL